MREALSKKNADPTDAGKAYVQFAKDNREMFFLMSDPSCLDASNPALAQARQNSLKGLAATRGVSSRQPTLEEIAGMMSNWTVVHGFAMLMLTGRLELLLNLAPPSTTLTDLLDATLNSMRVAH